MVEEEKSTCTEGSLCKVLIGAINEGDTGVIHRNLWYTVLHHQEFPFLFKHIPFEKKIFLSNSLSCLHQAMYTRQAFYISFIKCRSGAADECKYWHWFGRLVCRDLMPYTGDLVMADAADNLAQGLAKSHRCIGGVEMKKAARCRFAETARFCAQRWP